MIRIVTDSTCDIPAQLLARYRITVVPINIQFGQETYQEGETLSDDEFYRKVEQTGSIPTTSQPSLGQFMNAYRAVAAEPETEAIVSVHITGELSGTYNAAVIAAGEMPAEPPITVFDSRGGSMGLGFLVLEAAQMAATGQPVSAILARLEEVSGRMHIFFSLEDLRFARMSGRVSSMRALLVSLLSIKPMLTVDQGRLAMLKRVRSRTQALQMLTDVLCEKLSGLPAQVAVIHAQAPEDAQAVLAALSARLDIQEAIIHSLSIGIAVHLGPGTVGVVGYNP